MTSVRYFLKLCAIVALCVVTTCVGLILSTIVYSVAKGEPWLCQVDSSEVTAAKIIGLLSAPFACFAMRYKDLRKAALLLPGIWIPVCVAFVLLVFVPRRQEVYIPIQVAYIFWVATFHMICALIWYVLPDLGRKRAGECERCGYCLTANVSGVCPECGTPIEDNQKDRIDADTQ